MVCIVIVYSLLLSHRPALVETILCTYLKQMHACMYTTEYDNTLLLCAILVIVLP